MTEQKRLRRVIPGAILVSGNVKATREESHEAKFVLKFYERKGHRRSDGSKYLAS